jgi:hypothetical protein
MNGHSRKLLTVVTEAALENVLTHEIGKLGAHGYTITDARGKGRRGARNAGWEHSGNIRVEIICDAATAKRISEHLWEHYYEDYAMILTVSDVEVLRPEKF